MIDNYPRHIVGAMGIVTHKDGRVLLVKTQRREWEPPGGQVELGENLIEALEREILEESGCSVQAGRLCGVYSNTGRREAASPEQVLFTFLCEWTGGEPCAGHECSDAGWFTREQALRLITHPAQLDKVQDALANDVGVVYRAYKTHPYEISTERHC